MRKINVLLAEDELVMGRLIKEALELNNYHVIWSLDGVKALSSYKVAKPDICIFDIMMPFKDGLTLVKEIRAYDRFTPIILLTAKSNISDLAEGFNIGANDYVKKPFSLEELIIRMQALLRNSNIDEKPSITTVDEYNIGKYHFNFKKLHLVFEDSLVILSYTEALLLKLLIENQNSILERKTALNIIWGNDSYFNSRSMDVFITKIRKFLEKDPNIKIINIRGTGYKLIVC